MARVGPFRRISAPSARSNLAHRPSLTPLQSGPEPMAAGPRGHGRVARVGQLSRSRGMETSAIRVRAPPPPAPLQHVVPSAPVHQRRSRCHSRSVVHQTPSGTPINILHGIYHISIYHVYYKSQYIHGIYMVYTKDIKYEFSCMYSYSYAVSPCHV